MLSTESTLFLPFSTLRRKNRRVLLYRRILQTKASPDLRKSVSQGLVIICIIYYDKQIEITSEERTMSVLELLRQRRDEILKLASQHGARNVRVFGSAARGEANADSDIDFLVELETDRTLFDLGALLMDLQDLLGRKIDIVTDDSIYWLLRRKILKEAVSL
ncbi:MAG: nucleotidyltransferase family protein [Sedimentisphaerales bacterium]|nr:nucleotidyltransferase family protein [Sedimentisphaerales bacterium]